MGKYFVFVRTVLLPRDNIFNSVIAEGPFPNTCDLRSLTVVEIFLQWFIAHDFSILQCKKIFIGKAISKLPSDHFFLSDHTKINSSSFSAVCQICDVCKKNVFICMSLRTGLLFYSLVFSVYFSALLAFQMFKICKPSTLLTLKQKQKQMLSSFTSTYFVTLIL